MSKVLRAHGTIFLLMRDDETQEEAEDRLFQILDAEDIDGTVFSEVEVLTSDSRHEGKNIMDV